MPTETELIKQITGLSIGEWICIALLCEIIKFFITVWIYRWIFRVNEHTELLKEISFKMDDLARRPIDLDELLGKRSQTEAEKYGPK